ncbi:metacaspase-6 [Ziziphus jujuba]|uniref:Metacaspase-6 n=1 Tax=Ziziphus jujuba TaxID=326968 RepID=A0ABM4AC32_ZIZJJ|nr:metacaspase-6 [Ziziphus jujuba]
MGRKALLIGCNYPGTTVELNGCVNDVYQMKKCLLDRYGFSDDNITVLIDTDDSCTQPTGKNIYDALTRLVQSAEPGDILFIHYSGHGSRFPLEIGEDDETGYDECLVPCDMNFIFDDDLRDIVDQVPEGCSITIVSDSCHSGGLIGGAKEQIGESTEQHEEEKDQNEIGYFRHGHMKSRALPLPTLIDILNEKTGKPDIDVGNLRSTLFEVFGDEVSPKVKKFMKEYNMRKENKPLNCINGAAGAYLGMVGSKARELTKLRRKLEIKADLYNAKHALATQVVEGGVDGTGKQRHELLPKGGLLFSGCQTFQISGDVVLSGKDDVPCGAFSHAIQTIIAESGGQITNRELVLKATKFLKSKGLDQQPGLYCNDDHACEPLRTQINGAPFEDARHLAHRYDKLRQEVEAQVTEILRHRSKSRDLSMSGESAVKLQSAEARLADLKSSTVALGREVTAAMLSV